MFPALENTLSEVADEAGIAIICPASIEYLPALTLQKSNMSIVFSMMNYQGIYLPPLLNFPLQLFSPFVCICCSIPLCVMIV